MGLTRPAYPSTIRDVNVISTPIAQPETIRDLTALVVGESYEVVIHDCCVNGEFVSAFTGRTDDDWHTVMFANGVRLDGDYLGQGWKAFPATESTSGATPTPG
jgi:hypothetical protein